MLLLWLSVSWRGTRPSAVLLGFNVFAVFVFLTFVCLGFVVASSEGRETRELAWLSLEALLARWWAAPLSCLCQLSKMEEFSRFCFFTLWHQVGLVASATNMSYGWGIIFLSTRRGNFILFPLGLSTARVIQIASSSSSSSSRAEEGEQIISQLVQSGHLSMPPFWQAKSGG